MLTVSDATPPSAAPLARLGYPGARPPGRTDDRDPATTAAIEAVKSYVSEPESISAGQTIFSGQLSHVQRPQAEPWLEIS